MTGSAFPAGAAAPEALRALRRPLPPPRRARAPRFCIVGAGHGGLAMAAHLAARGFDTRLYNRSPARLEALRRTGGVWLHGRWSGDGAPRSAFAALRAVQDNLEEALKGTDIVMVVVPAAAHAELARGMAAHLQDGQIVVLNPGRTGGALEFTQVLAAAGCRAAVTVAEAATLLYACRATGPAEATVFSVKRSVPLAALPAARTAWVLERLRAAFPQFTAAPDVLATGFDNLGAVFHPAPFLFNLGRAESGEAFEHYRGGITPSVARVLEALDAERLAVARAWGAAVPSALEWLERSYGVRAGRLLDAIRATLAYAGILAPSTADSRYLTEDVPTGLVPISEFGRAAGVPTPTVDAVIALASAAAGVDYRARGRTLSRLGLAGRSVAEIRRYVKEGSGSA
ncbi:MAG: NAD/NADP octopine/nopaline dehydrogenase family protein [Firmicutes bacterium]|nr:NAD/NADP octopine/nopaline dehydrogenase family protein [Bacillota bacterium]